MIIETTTTATKKMRQQKELNTQTNTPGDTAKQTGPGQQDSYWCTDRGRVGFKYVADMGKI
jgi:hypothetical protein